MEIDHSSFLRTDFAHVQVQCMPPVLTFGGKMHCPSVLSHAQLAQLIFDLRGTVV